MIPGCTCVVAPELALVYELLWLIAQPLWLIAEPLRIIAVPVSVLVYLFVCLLVSLYDLLIACLCKAAERTGALVVQAAAQEPPMYPV